MPSLPQKRQNAVLARHGVADEFRDAAVHLDFIEEDRLDFPFRGQGLQHAEFVHKPQINNHLLEGLLGFRGFGLGLRHVHRGN